MVHLRLAQVPPRPIWIFTLGLAMLSGAQAMSGRAGTEASYLVASPDALTGASY